MPEYDPIALQAWMMRSQQMADQAAARRQSSGSNRAAMQQMALQAYLAQLAQQQQLWAFQNQQQQYNTQLGQQQRSDNLSKEYQKKLDAANQKNEDRYLDILSGRLGTRDRVLADLGNWGDSQITDAKDRNKSMLSQMNADIYSRGFGGSPSMLGSAKRSANTALSRDMERIQDDIINRRTNADSGLSDSVFNFMERRNDMPPDLSQLIALQQGLGRSGSRIPMAVGAPPSPSFTPPGYPGAPPNYQPNPGMGQLNPGYRNNYLQNRYNGGGNANGMPNDVPFSGGIPQFNPMAFGGPPRAGVATPTLPMPRPMGPPTTDYINDFKGMQQDSAQQSIQQAPWNSGNPYANYDGAPKNFIPMPGGGYQNARQPMPALGIFGAGVTGGSLGFGPQIPYGVNTGGPSQFQFQYRDYSSDANQRRFPRRIPRYSPAPTTDFINQYLPGPAYQSQYA